MQAPSFTGPTNTINPMPQSEIMNFPRDRHNNNEKPLIFSSTENGQCTESPQQTTERPVLVNNLGKDNRIPPMLIGFICNRTICIWPKSIFDSSFTPRTRTKRGRNSRGPGILQLKGPKNLARYKRIQPRGPTRRNNTSQLGAQRYHKTPCKTPPIAEGRGHNTPHQ
jgi:hypothetical protein